MSDTPKEVDYLDLSDEDFDKLPEPDFTADSEEKEEEATSDVNSDTDSKEDPEPEEDSEPKKDPELEKDPESDPKENEPEKDDKTPDSENEDDDSTTEDKTPEIDYKAQYEALMAPFKANGTEITPKSPEDAIRLMQMGANYHKKMAGMKPSLKAQKLLENNGLLDEEKLNFLIDLHNGNPEAIAELLKKSKIDPLDVDVNTETTYKPSNRTVSDAELELDSVLENIQGSPNYAKTLNTVTKEWDQESQNQAAANPQIISVINGHMDSGIYDQVMEAVNYDRSVGNIPANVSDLEAYKIAGNRLEQEGALKSTATTQNAVKPTPKVDPKAEQKRKAQKKAAGPTGSSAKKVSKLPPDFNPLNLSDEEFEKFDPKLIGL